MIAAPSVAKDLTVEISELRDELRHAQAELRRSDESKRRFVDLASRELRTPITLLLGYAKLLESESAEISKEYARVFLNHARQLKDAVDLMITLQRIDANELVLRADRLGLAAVIQDAVDGRRRELDEKEMSVQVRVEDGVFVNADREQLHLMLSQVLAHVIQRTAARQVITVAVSVESSAAIITVRSRSEGAVAETFTQVLERSQTANEDARLCDGFGLPLLAVKALAELQGGTLWLGNSDDCGEALSFSLPRADLPAQMTHVTGQPYRSQMRTAVF